jgi:hypothetical protein
MLPLLRDMRHWYSTKQLVYRLEVSDTSLTSRGPSGGTPNFTACQSLSRPPHAAQRPQRSEGVHSAGELPRKGHRRRALLQPGRSLLSSWSLALGVYVDSPLLSGLFRLQEKACPEQDSAVDISSSSWLHSALSGVALLQIEVEAATLPIGVATQTLECTTEKKGRER